MSVTRSHHLSILHVDDDDLVRAAAARSLGAAGHRVESAAGSDEAIAATAARRFDVGIFDLELGTRNARHDGVWLAQRLFVRQLVDRVVFFSGATSATTLTRARAWGELIAKPQFDALVAALGKRHP